MALVRLALPEFVLTDLEEPFNALIDVDIFTPPNFSTDDAELANTWIENAHIFEKQQFFRLFTDELLKLLEEE